MSSTAFCAQESLVGLGKFVHCSITSVAKPAAVDGGHIGRAFKRGVQFAQSGWLGIAMLTLPSTVDAAWQASACEPPACRLCASAKHCIQFTGCLQLRLHSQIFCLRSFDLLSTGCKHLLVVINAACTPAYAAAQSGPGSCPSAGLTTNAAKVTHQPRS